MSELHSGERRKYLRYNPTVHSIQNLQEKAMEATAHIDLAQQEEFSPKIHGLIVEKSHAGCSVAFVKADQSYDLLEQGKECLVKAGPLHPMKAVVRWRKNLDDDLFKVGFQYME